MKSEKEIKQLIDAYNYLVKGIETIAEEDDTRAYGGIIRSGKGTMVENIARHCVEIAWRELDGNEKDLFINKKKVHIPINIDYIDRVQPKQVASYIREHIDEYYYGLSVDIHIFNKQNLVMGIECKAYTENAMIKRILVDFSLLKHLYPDMKCILFQLENQLNGDYGDVEKKIHYGSTQTHTIMSYFNVDLQIITLLQGDRKVDEPIHKSEYYKELTDQSMRNAIDIIKENLK